MDFSEEYRIKIRQEYDDVVSKTAFWREFVKYLTEIRGATAKLYESGSLGSMSDLATHMERKGEIAAYDKVFRLVSKILDRGK